MDSKKSLNIKKTFSSASDELVHSDESGTKSLLDGQRISNDKPLSEDSVPQKPSSNYINDIDLVAKTVVKILGRTPLENIRGNPNFPLTLDEPDMSLDQWVVFVIKTLFSVEDIYQLSEGILSHRYTKAEAFELGKQKLKSKFEEKNKLITELSGVRDEFKRSLGNVTSQLDKSVSLSHLLEKFIGRSGDTRRIIELVHEDIEDNSPDVVGFTIGLAKGWGAFKASLNATDDRMNAIHSELTHILQHISGLYTAQRRDVLIELAKIANSYLDEYEFVSPEHTLNVDPTLHNVAGLGGTEIKEGLSYSVIRKDTRKTVIYADVVVS